MKARLLYLVLALATILFSQCTSTSDVSESPTYNEFISGYTSGSVPRNSPVRVLFSQEIAPGKLDSLQANEVMSISPKVEGNFSFADSRTVVFVPKSGMERNTQYNVSVDVNKLFGQTGTFKFGFKTRPFALGGNLKGFEVTDDDQYELTFNLLTADSESAKAVEGHVELNMQGESTWSHSADGMMHQLKFRVKPKSDCKLVLATIADNSIGMERQVLSESQLPSAETFSVVSQRCKPGDSKAIEITFNKNLDPKQDIKGLVFINGKETEVVAEGNKVIMTGYFEEGEQVSIMIEKTLRSRSGLKLTSAPLPPLTISTDKPQVEFVGDGTIIPQSDKILVPFRLIHMRGVRVAVFRMFSNMMGTMLQNGDLDNYSNLSYAARPIVTTTFYVEDPSLDLSEWHTFALDLTDQVKLEPGAMYRIEMALDARLSAWPSDSLPQATREQMAAADAEVLEQCLERFDNGNYYYTGQTFGDDNDWWYDDYYTRRQDPSTTTYYKNRAVGKNVLATNLGLTALKGSDNTINVTVINLPDAQPVSGATVEAYSMQQQLVGTGKTDDKGISVITYDHKMGRPAYLIARKGNDVSYLKVTDDLSLSTSTFDVSGHVIERGLKGFIYGDRGVWRPGDTLHIAFMLNDRHKTLPADHPVTLTLSNPLGQIAHRATRTEGQMGLYAFNIPVAADAVTGVWSAQVNVGGVSFSKNIRIEAIKPNRLKIDLKLPSSTLSAGKSTAQLSTEWLNGNAASGLKYAMSATIVETKTGWKAHPGYVFDDPTKSFDTSEQDIAKGEVDSRGQASAQLNINTGKTAPGMLLGNIVTHVYEPSGEFSVDVAQTLIAPYDRFVGVKVPTQDGQSHLDTEKDHTFSVLSVNKDGNAVPGVSVKVDVYKVDWYWWWNSSREDMADYTASSYHQPVKSLDVLTDSQGKGSFKLQMSEANWGTYLIMVRDKTGGHSAGTLSYFDWPWMTSRRSSSASENATALSITTDKKEYAPGEKMKISIPSEEGSRAIVSISNGSHILYLNTYPCQKERTEITLDATEEMSPNIYIGVSLVQPYSQTLNDMPIRMYGLTPVAVNSPKSHLEPQISTSDEYQPETTAKVVVSEKSGRPMAYTLAIVDEGLLDLTRFKTPNAWDVFNAREALGVRFFDLYKHVNGAYGGRIEQLFSIGGDEALNNGPKAIVNRFTPMVHFVGPFTLKKGEKATHKVPVPNYNGRVRVMVVAGDGSAYGSADKSVLVRRPLMMIGTMPRQIGRNDEMTVSATLFATQKLGDVKVTLSSKNGLEVVGDKTQSVRFDEAGDKTVQFRIKAGNQGGVGTVSLVASNGSLKADYTAEIDIRTVSQTISKTVEHRIEPGAAFEETYNLPGDGDYQLLLDVSAHQPLNLSGRVKGLISYPHGCAEQTTSKAFSQLYLSELSTLTPEQQKEIEENIKYGINRLSAFQTADGGMSYWPGQRQSHPWASAYLLHFLNEAGARGYYVPDEMLRKLKNYVSAQANAWTLRDDANTAAYQLYVLAVMQSAEIGAMNRMREQSANISQRANRLLAGAYALSGRADIARELMRASGNAEAYNGGWFSMDVAVLLAELSLDDKHAEQTAEVVRKRLSSDNWLSTSDCSFSILAMSQYYKTHNVGKGLKFKASIDGKEVADVNSPKFSWTSTQSLDKKQAKLSVRNGGEAPVYVSITSQGVATQSPVQKASNGLELALSYTSENGQPLSPYLIGQSTTFKASLIVRNTSGKNLENVAVTHILPAGWEILSKLPSGNVSYQDQRDDRMLSYIDRLAKDESVNIRFNISATYAGHYYLPSVHAEAMYDATIMGCTESAECTVVNK